MAINRECNGFVSLDPLPTPPYSSSPAPNVAFSFCPFVACSASEGFCWALYLIFVSRAAMAQEGGENRAAAKAVSITAFKPQLLVPAGTVDKALRFYREAFLAEELKRTYHPKRKAEQEFPLVVSAELKIGSSSLLVCEKKEDYPVAVEGAKGAGIVFRVETEDVEGAVAKAVKAGAVLHGEITEEDGLYGSGLQGTVKDPFGVVWAFASPGRKCAEAVA